MKMRMTNEHKIIGFFLTFIVITMGLITYSSRRSNLEIDTTSELFYQLDNIRKREGLDRFLEQKVSLRSQITTQLRKPLSEEQEAFALSVALYLFPEVLPKSNFERSIGLEQWAPLQNAIENHPHTENARAWFEEMRANIWNYENSDAKNPVLSEPANQVLRIYNELSSK